jgi:hypothetical protein
MRFFNTFKDRLVRNIGKEKGDSLSPVVPSDANRYIAPLTEKPNNRPELKIPKHGHKS